MLFIRILNFIKGFVQLSVRGFFIERFLNICMHRDIYLWDVKRRGQHQVHVKMSINGFRSLRPIARKTHTSVHILEKHGLPFLLHRHKKRKAFLVGAVMAVALLVYLTSFVWVIEVTGNVAVDTGQILAALEKNGLKEGKLRRSIDVAALQNQMMLDIDELSWLWVDIKGTKATVEVKEKKPIPEIVDKDTPCNLVAAKRGLVTSVVATYGEKMVKVGDVVEAGDLLVSGVVGSRFEGVRYLHSSGSIKARTYYEKEGEFPCVKVNMPRTGKKISKNTLHLFDFKVQLYAKGQPPYTYYETEHAVHRMNLGGNNFLPFYVTTDTYYEQLRQEEPLTPEQAAEIGKAQLEADIESTFGEDTTVVTKDSTFTPLENGNVLVKVSYECMEEIGQTVQIEVAE